MSTTTQNPQNTTHIDGEFISFGGSSLAGQSGEDGAVNFKTRGNVRLQFDAESVHTLGLRTDSIKDTSNNDIIENVSDSQIKFHKNINFNNVSITGFTGSGSATGLSTADITSSNTGYTTADSEFDDLHTRTTLNTNRTSGLTANRVIASSGAGIIEASSMDSSRCVAMLMLLETGVSTLWKVVGRELRYSWLSIFTIISGLAILFVMVR